MMDWFKSIFDMGQSTSQPAQKQAQQEPEPYVDPVEREKKAAEVGRFLCDQDRTYDSFFLMTFRHLI